MSITLSLKAGAKIALAALLVLLLGSIVFWKERMLFSDASFIAFRIINFGTIQTQVGRYGAFITQIFPYIASKLHLPITAVLFLYSVSFNLFYLFTGWVLYRMKQYPLVIIWTFYLTLYVSDTYFWTNNEVHQGIAWMFLNFGLLQYLFEKFKDNRAKFLIFSIPVFILLSFIAIYTHPLVMISFGFLWVFFVLAKQPLFNNKISILFALIAVLICVFKFLASQNNWYDGGFVHNITHTTLPAILKTFRSELAHDFWQGGIRNYWLLWFIFLSGSVYLFIQKKYALFAYVLISCLGYFILICLAFYPSKAFYIESEWMSLGILGSAAFVYFLLPKLKPVQVMALLVFVFVVRMGYIYVSSQKFSERVAFLEKVNVKMKEKNLSKIIVLNTNDSLENELLLTWGLPYETMLYSAMKGDKPTKTMSYLKKEVMDQYNALGNPRCIFSAFGPFCNNEINQHYFQMDTTNFYSLMALDAFSKD